MSYSLNEVEALAKRATRGGGYAWGLAEDAGKSVRWLTSHGLPGPSLLASLLKLNDGLQKRDVAPQSFHSPWTGSTGRLCPLMSGAALSDCATQFRGGSGIELLNISHPLLILPSAASVAKQIGTVVSLQWSNLQLATDGHALSVTGSHEKLITEDFINIRCVAHGDLTSPNLPNIRSDMDISSYKQLCAFAHRTYAPATSESRLLGAGAGLSDND